MIPVFDTQEAELKWLKENKRLLLHTKKTTIKHTDSMWLNPHFVYPGSPEYKEASAENGSLFSTDAPQNLDALLVLNTTNFLDSHKDVHLPGIWKKTLADNAKNGFYLLQEHERRFDKVIAENVVASTKSMTWKSLGYDYEGSSQALLFKALLEPDRNPYMYEQYAKGRVKQHSVGMYYDQMFMCVNSTDKWWAEEKENWDKYYDEIINPEALGSSLMFWAVKSARLVEGSAVLLGSNSATPTLAVGAASKVDTLQTALDEAKSEVEAIQKQLARAQNRFRTIGKKF